MELERYVALPKIFKKRKVMEISRLCVDPNYRKSDLLLSLFKELTYIGCFQTEIMLYSRAHVNYYPTIKSLGPELGYGV